MRRLPRLSHDGRGIFLSKYFDGFVTDSARL